MNEEVEESFGGFVINDTDKEQEEGQAAGSLYDVGDDVLSSILSFLSPADISACACVSQRLRELCQDDHKVWYPMCERRFGRSTNICNWGATGCVPFRVLHSVLSRFENLVGFWRGVENIRHGSLVVFEWRSHNILGYRIIPAQLGSYKVCKVPFVWIGVLHGGRPVSLLDPDWEQLVPGLLENGTTGSSVTRSPGEGRPSSQPLQIPVSPATSAAKAADSSSGRVSPFEALGSDWNLEQPPPTGLVLVDVHFVGSHHIVIEDCQQAQYMGYPFSGKKTLVEAAALASFGSSENLCQAGGSPGEHSPSSSGGGSDAGKSHPGSFPYEMYQFLTKKVTSPGGDRAARKQRRRERERAFSQGRRHCEPEHFVKISHFRPTQEFPLQGLWKGIGRSTGLDFVLLSYDDQGGIICRRVGDTSGTTRSGSVYWTAKSGCGFPAPLPESEQQNYELRHHIRPTACGSRWEGAVCTDYVDEEVVEMLWAALNADHYGLNYSLEPANSCSQGRVWQYASGRFGFGSMPDGRVVDFRPICFEESLADVVDLIWT